MGSWLRPQAGKRLAFHEALGLLGVGDLHPGGQPASEFLLSELDKGHPHTVLEVGAGIGTTTARMLKRGWQVVAIEPSDVLRGQLERRLRVPAVAGTFETFSGVDGTFDAVVGESVFYGMDLPRAFAKVHRLLRPGGLFANLDTVWSPRAAAGEVAAIHDLTESLFGIPVASRDPWTWADWGRLLGAAGFAPVNQQRLPAGALKRDQRARNAILRGALWHPSAFLQHLAHRRQYRSPRIPPEWTETFMAVWKRA